MADMIRDSSNDATSLLVDVCWSAQQLGPARLRPRLQAWNRPRQLPIAGSAAWIGRVDGLQISVQKTWVGPMDGKRQFYVTGDGEPQTGSVLRPPARLLHAIVAGSFVSPRACSRNASPAQAIADPV